MIPPCTSAKPFPLEPGSRNATMQLPWYLTQPRTQPRANCFVRSWRSEDIVYNWKWIYPSQYSTLFCTVWHPSLSLSRSPTVSRSCLGYWEGKNTGDLTCDYFISYGSLDLTTSHRPSFPTIVLRLPTHSHPCCHWPSLYPWDILLNDLRLRRLPALALIAFFWAVRSPKFSLTRYVLESTRENR